MSPFITILILIAYFGLLMLVAKLTANRRTDNATFYLANRQMPWYLVAFGMIGASISGVSLVSVPGMVGASQFSYLQTTLGFCFGYLVVAFVLIPLYYRLNLTSIYGYLGCRFGLSAHRTGAVFFIIAKMITSATKLYVAVIVLQQFVFDAWGVPLWATVTVCVLLIWLYTRNGGIRTIVWTDVVQTFFLLVAMMLILLKIMQLMDLNIPSAGKLLNHHALSRVFVFDDWHSTRHFLKQFFSGIFIVIVMTGLNQDMMQKNLSCRNEHESRRNMLWYGAAFIPVNLVLLVIGALLLIYAGNENILLPQNPDAIVPFFAAHHLGQLVCVCFVIGIIAASFSSADSALTAVTTSVMVDFLKKEKGVALAEDRRLRRRVHLGVCVLFVGITLLFECVRNQSLIDVIYTLVGYAYGPLLGLFAFGLLTKRQVRNRAIPCIAIAAPVITYIMQTFCALTLNYHFGYELLIINGLITFIGLAVAVAPKMTVSQ
ncbi:MAG: sodium:solute symporter [Prevotellaceae bacterium]|jgi:Na+/proline symporter|nr:sodium:solute symporter [Prevotellaceae bacterium]